VPATSRGNSRHGNAGAGGGRAVGSARRPQRRECRPRYRRAPRRRIATPAIVVNAPSSDSRPAGEPVRGSDPPAVRATGVAGEVAEGSPEGRDWTGEGDVGLVVGDAVGVVVGDEVGDVVGVGEASGSTLLVIDVRHVTSEPPPLADPLHWLTVTGRDALCVELGATEQVTVLPPPLPEPLHCVTAAPEVELTGLQVIVPLPSAEPTHSLTVAAVGVAPPVMLLVMSTAQTSSPPPPLAEALHWLTESTTSWNVLVTAGPQVGAPAAPVHTCSVTEEPPTPVAASRVLTTVTLHLTL